MTSAAWAYADQEPDLFRDWDDSRDACLNLTDACRAAWLAQDKIASKVLETAAQVASEYPELFEDPR